MFFSPNGCQMDLCLVCCNHACYLALAISQLEGLNKCSMNIPVDNIPTVFSRSLKLRSYPILGLWNLHEQHMFDFEVGMVPI
jgi:hypothetical protein